MSYLKINGLGKTYSNRKNQESTPAVQDVDLEVKRGEFVSILGPSGCGKSTLLNIVAGLLEPTTGDVIVDDEMILSPLTNMGYVFQQDMLLPWRTVKQNILIQAELRKADKEAMDVRAMELLREVGLNGFELVLPHQLSGGMRQRAAICRALVHDPPLMLMDEPFGALDAMTREKMTVDLASLHETQQKTVMFVTHSISEAVLLSDRIVVMSARPGKLEEIVDVDLSRPRTSATRMAKEFDNVVHKLERIFESMGAL